MTATNHVLTGAVIALSVQNPVIALPLAVMSHFALDGLPHFDLKINDHSSGRFQMLLYSDMFVASVVLLSIAATRPAFWPLMIACGILAASPDLMWFPNYLRGLKGQKLKTNGAIASLHSKVQWLTGPFGAAIELLWFLLALSLITLALVV